MPRPRVSSSCSVLWNHHRFQNILTLQTGHPAPGHSPVLSGCRSAVHSLCVDLRLGDVLWSRDRRRCGLTGLLVRGPHVLKARPGAAGLAGPCLFTARARSAGTRWCMFLLTVCRRRLMPHTRADTSSRAGSAGTVLRRLRPPWALLCHLLYVGPWSRSNPNRTSRIHIQSIVLSICA